MSRCGLFQERVTPGGLPEGDDGLGVSEGERADRGHEPSIRWSTTSSPDCDPSDGPGHVGVALEPRHLPPRVAPGERLRLGDRLGPRRRAVQLGERLRVADRAARGDAAFEAPCSQRLDLVEEAVRPHPLDARVEARDQLVARTAQADDASTDATARARRAAPRRASPRPARAPRARARCAGRSAGRPARRSPGPRVGRRVVAARPGPSRSSSASSSARRAASRGGKRKSKSTLETYRPDPPTRIASRSAIEDLVDRGARGRLVPGDRGVVGDLEHVEQVMRDAAPLGRAGASPCRCPCRDTAASRRR